MCGIAGIVGKNEIRYRELVPQMLQAIKYRGPDDTGELYVDDCALGHVRLSIVDLQNGKQPMMDAAGNTAVVFNGEIYGYKDIKPNLNYPFSTDCDTEVILALYQKYGRNMIQHLPGMFAFALWDSKNKSLYCARDRFGEKPFYYAWGNNGEFIFASEIKAILASGMVEPVLDYQQLNHYLCYSYIYPAKTIYKNIFVLPPASQLILQNGKLTVERYWYQPDTNDKINIDEAVEQFRFLFSRAVKRQLVADVPVGAFLSGGLDSGSVVAAAVESFGVVDMLDYVVSSGFLPGDDLDNALRVDQQEYLTGNGMLKTDRTTMAVSLESRTPFLDVDLAEFCISLPFAMKVRGKEEKYILRRAFESMWTDKVRNTIKNGFASPIDVWMKRPEFQILLDTYLGDKNKKVFNVIDYSKTCELRKNNRELFLI